MKRREIRHYAIAPSAEGRVGAANAVKKLDGDTCVILRRDQAEDISVVQ